MKHFARYLAGVVLLSTLAGCGWHLRGSTAGAEGTARGALEVPVEVELSASAGTDAALLKALRQRMKQHRLIETENSTLRVQLGQTEWRYSRLRANAAGDAQAQLITLRQPLFVGGGEQVLADEVLEVSRDIQLDPTAMAASEQARRWQQAEMRQEMADRILRRLEALLAAS